IHHVADLEIAASEITARVRGGEEYRVCLRPDQRELRGDCTCPYGREGFFCKHCVAVGLAVLEMEKELPQLLEEARAEWRTLESWLGTLSREELLAELLGLLDDDRELRRRMELRAASLNADAAKVRRVVRELITAAHREYLDYKYANDVYQAAAAIDELAEGGAP